MLGKYKYLENINDNDIECEARIISGWLTRIDIRLENRTITSRDFVDLSRHRMELFEYHKALLEQLVAREIHRDQSMGEF